MSRSRYRSVITLGGNSLVNPSGYSIAKFFPSGSVTNFNRPWPGGFSVAWCTRLAMSLDRMTVLVGFSAGASAALITAGLSPYVTHCFAHSPRDRGDRPRKTCEYHLFLTNGDSTPGANQVYDVAKRLRSVGAEVHADYNLPFEQFYKPTWLERTVLTRRRHQFHNCIPFLQDHPATSHLWI